MFRWSGHGLLLTLALMLASACGSRSGLSERRVGSSGGSGGALVGSGGSSSGTGGSRPGSGGRPASSGGSATGGDISMGGEVNTGGAGGSCSGTSCCGDGNVESPEACDDGNSDSTDDCTELCQLPVCGDGFLRASEDCDDGNTSDGDECPADCALEVLQLTMGGAYVCVLLNTERIKCWGANDDGELGLGDEERRGDEPNEMGAALPIVDLGIGRTVEEVAGGWYHACALLDDHSIKCWGMNLFGQLGLGDNDWRGEVPGQMGDALPTVALGSGRSARALGAGIWHTCALLDDGSIKCWGYNGQGQLGLGDTVNRGDDPGEMGDVLPSVPLGTGRFAKDIAPGSYHTCALLDDDSVKCWGLNDQGQLGLGDAAWRGHNSDELGDALPPVDLGTGRTAKTVAAGHGFTCALLDDDSVKCWGTNVSGQLGLGDTVNRGDDPDEMGDALPTVDLGTGRSARALVVGTYHACALLDDDYVKCWGENSTGQLGLGDGAFRGDAPGEMGDALPAVDLGSGPAATVVVAGGFQTCALRGAASVKCWGGNDFGQLGLGDVQWRGGSPNEMGDTLPELDLW